MHNRPKYLKGPCGSCGGNIEFPVEMVGTTIDCPHCQKPTELLLASVPEETSLPRRALAWTLAAIIILALGLAGALIALKRAQRLAEAEKEQVAAQQAATRQQQALQAQSQAPEVKSPAEQAGFDVSPIRLERAPGTSLVYAVGTVTNTSARQRFGVKLELDLLDASGVRLGGARDYQQVLEPNAQWQFKALVVDSKAATAKLASIKEDQ